MISVVMLTKNNGKYLKESLNSLCDFPEIVIIDTGSTDDTEEIARSYQNVRFFSSGFLGFGKLRNLGAKCASHDWILALDSDEVLSPKLQETLREISLDEKKLYQFPFHNFYKGKRVRCCGWDPEFHIRLYHKKITSFDHAYVHEGIEKKDLKVETIPHPILHTPYRSIDDFLVKMHKYSTLFAKQNRDQKNSSFLKAFIHGSGAFFKSYLLKKGIFYGSMGFIIASYNASCAFYKYLKLMEENSKTS
jgi:glycosyltransferase involved in cell wall biosynthesis